MMLLFGHLGIGSNLVKPLSEGLPPGPLLLGTLLPDFIDKPIYYVLLFITQRPAAELPLIHGTRSFGHTACFLLILTLSAILKQSRILAALSLGVASHLLIDSFSNESFHFSSSLLWPLSGLEFPQHRYHQFSEYYSYILHSPVILFGEFTGFILFLSQYGKNIQAVFFNEIDKPKKRLNRKISKKS